MRLWLKILLVLGMTLVILVPLGLVRGVIGERQQHRAQAVAEIARSEAGAQRLAGPVLVVPWTEVVEVEHKDASGQVLRVTRRDGASGEWLFFPARMAVEGTLVPYQRHRGLHEVRMYQLDGTVEAAFDVRIPADADPRLPRRIGQPWLGYGVADVRGLRGSPRLQVDGRAMALRQGIGPQGDSGLHVRLPVPRAGERLALATRLELSLAGAESLEVVPVADHTRVGLASAWAHPQFNGAFLPGRREVGKGGFQAQWELSSLASSAQAQLRVRHQARSGDGHAVPLAEGQLDAIGVSLVDPVNPYSLAGRASKYGVLFVLLTFVGFFMFELLRDLRIHPIQYGLVGLALAIFFLLLVSLSEHIRFGLAYLVAGAACVGLVGVYVSAVLRSRVHGLGFTAMLATLYAALYGLLVSEDNALVLGAGLLFLVLAGIMLATRRVDWYQVASRQR